MIHEVNKEGGPETVTLKYFEKGHTFMSVDAFQVKCPIMRELRAFQKTLNAGQIEIPTH